MWFCTHGIYSMGMYRPCCMQGAGMGVVATLRSSNIARNEAHLLHDNRVCSDTSKRRCQGGGDLTPHDLIAIHSDRLSCILHTEVHA